MLNQRLIRFLPLFFLMTSLGPSAHMLRDLPKSESPANKPEITEKQFWRLRHCGRENKGGRQPHCQPEAENKIQAAALETAAAKAKLLEQTIALKERKRLPFVRRWR